MMAGWVYKRLVNNIVQSLKPVFGAKPLRQAQAANAKKNRIFQNIHVKYA